MNDIIVKAIEKAYDNEVFARLKEYCSLMNQELALKEKNVVLLEEMQELELRKQELELEIKTFEKDEAKLNMFFKIWNRFLALVSVLGGIGIASIFNPGFLLAIIAYFVVFGDYFMSNIVVILNFSKSLGGIKNIFLMRKKIDEVKENYDQAFEQLLSDQMDYATLVHGRPCACGILTYPRTFTVSSRRRILRPPVSLRPPRSI